MGRLRILEVHHRAYTGSTSWLPVQQLLLRNAASLQELTLPAAFIEQAAAEAAAAAAAAEGGEAKGAAALPLLPRLESIEMDDVDWPASVPTDSKPHLQHIGGFLCRRLPRLRELLGTSPTPFLEDLLVGRGGSGGVSWPYLAYVDISLPDPGVPQMPPPPARVGLPASRAAVALPRLQSLRVELLPPPPAPDGEWQERRVHVDHTSLYRLPRLVHLSVRATSKQLLLRRGDPLSADPLH